MQSETEQLYIELPVPPNNTRLNHYLEDYFNASDLVGRQCEADCQTFVQAEQRNRLTSGDQTKFILILLSRAMRTADGFELNQNKTISTDELFIR